MKHLAFKTVKKAGRHTFLRSACFSFMSKIPPTSKFAIVQKVYHKIDHFLTPQNLIVSAIIKVFDNYWLRLLALPSRTTCKANVCNYTITVTIYGNWRTIRERPLFVGVRNCTVYARAVQTHNGHVGRSFRENTRSSFSHSNGSWVTNI